MGRVKELLLIKEEQEMEKLHQEMIENGDTLTIPLTDEDLINMEHQQSIDEIFNELNNPTEHEMITVELVTGQIVTLPKNEYEMLSENYCELY